MAEHLRDEVAELLRRPEQRPQLPLPRWDLLIRQARVAGLLPRVAWSLSIHGHFDAVPDPVRAHLESAGQVARAQRTEIEREIAYLQRALRDVVPSIVLLKGAAYLAADLPPGRARLFSDTDVLVPKSRLGDVESALLLAGWATTHHSAYDQRYYREWMHELPPLVHLKRQTALDVHHAISPETARIRPDTARLLADAVPIPGRPGLAMLCAPDLVLHSMLHLLVNDELSHGLRDLSDLDLLLRHWGGEPGFWPQLVERAAGHGLLRILGYALRLAASILETPVPPSALQATAAAAAPALVDRAMLAMWRRTLASPHPSLDGAAARLARFALYVRAHALRMPPVLLARHLSVKLYVRTVGDEAGRTATP